MLDVEDRDTFLNRDPVDSNLLLKKTSKIPRKLKTAHARNNKTKDFDNISSLNQFRKVDKTESPLSILNQ
jgi:hypothetical protein